MDAESPCVNILSEGGGHVIDGKAPASVSRRLGVDPLRVLVPVLVRESGVIGRAEP